MKFLNLFVACSVTAVMMAGSASAATYTQASTDLCSATVDVSPDADLCFGTTIENANAQQVNLNSDTFVVGTSSVTGLFGYTDWNTFQSVTSVSGDQQTGSITVDTNTYGMVSVLLKGSNTFSAYLFDEGLEGTLTFIMPSGNALSNYVIAGREISPVPLPAGGILLISALGGLGFAARRRRKAS